mmetsp:Transcript_32135/g.53097  ORF Transcript_32135/g.53097 Transcript_32135/m.53097 type:complete len:155 (+) Transcript_32135:896-1360(+)
MAVCSRPSMLLEVVLMGCQRRKINFGDAQRFCDEKFKKIEKCSRLSRVGSAEEAWCRWVSRFNLPNNDEPQPRSRRGNNQKQKVALRHVCKADCRQRKTVGDALAPKAPQGTLVRTIIQHPANSFRSALLTHLIFNFAKIFPTFVRPAHLLRPP